MTAIWQLSMNFFVYDFISNDFSYNFLQKRVYKSYSVKGLNDERGEGDRN